MASIGNDDLKKHLEELTCYQDLLAERAPTPAAIAFQAAVKSEVKRRASLEKCGRLLIHNKLSFAHQQWFQDSRLMEWTNYITFGAADIVSQQDTERLVAARADDLPTPWSETGKNEFLRLKNKDIEPKMKSRLGARGDLSQVFTQRDSPTADNEAIGIVLSSCLLRLRSGDLDHGDVFEGTRASTAIHWSARPEHQAC